MYLDMLNHLQEVYPEEGCGIIINKRGTKEWMPCTNQADNPYETFQIAAKDYVRAQRVGDIFAVVHSHPDASAEPSERDKKAADFLGVQYIVVSTPELEIETYTPTAWKQNLLGREYKFGENDCYSLVRDYYKQKLGISLPIATFEDDFWEKGYDYFTEFFQEFGFKEVQSPKENDLIFFNVMSPIPSHCGIYLGEDIFIHHARDRLSCRESIHSFWGRFITRYVRYANS